MSDTEVKGKNIREIELITLKINDVTFGINSDYVVSIDKELLSEDVPSDSTLVDRMVAFRGQIIPQVSLGKILFGLTSEENDKCVDIVCTVNGNMIGNMIALRTESVDSIIKSDTSKIIERGPILSSHAHEVSGFLQEDDKTIIEILDIEQMVKELGHEG